MSRVSVFLALLLGTLGNTELLSQNTYKPSHPGSFWGFGVGFSFRGATSTNNVFPFGGATNLFAGYRPTGWFAVRTEIGGVAFPPGSLIAVTDTPPCVPDGPCRAPRTGALGVFFAGGTIMIGGSSPTSGSMGHFTFGVASYLASRTAFGSLNSIGWNFGTAMDLSQNKTRKLFEIRVHRIPDLGSNGQSMWLIPVTFGVTFF